MELDEQVADKTYHVPHGGLPPQSERLADRALFTESFAFIPAEVQTDIVTSFLPYWQATRLWVLARPMTGFAESFSDPAAAGRATRSEPDTPCVGFGRNRPITSSESSWTSI